MNGMPMTAARCASNRKRSDQDWVSFLAFVADPRTMGGVCPAIVASALFGVALLSAGISSAAEPVQLRSRLGDWCLDGPNGNNAATVVNPCNGSNSQRWVLN